MNETLLNALINECTAAREVSKTEGQGAINATERLIEGIATVIYKHEEYSNYEEFIRKTGIHH